MYAAHPPGVQTAIKAGKRYRVLTTFPDATELLVRTTCKRQEEVSRALSPRLPLTSVANFTRQIEEYDIVTQKLECRRWRSPHPFGGLTNWEYEIGDDAGMETSETAKQALLRPSLMNPTFHPRDTRVAWEWHIRNLPYPKETYSLSVEEGKGALILRTTNKKYFKVFKVPALIRAGITLQQSHANFSHDGRSTLVISYAKPDSIVDEERKARKNAMCKK